MKRKPPESYLSGKILYSSFQNAVKTDLKIMDCSDSCCHYGCLIHVHTVCIQKQFGYSRWNAETIGKRILNSAKVPIGLFVLVLLLWSKGTASQAQHSLAPPSPKKATTIVLGAEQLNRITTELQRKRVALLVNHTSIVGGKRLIDKLISRGIDVRKIFCPEHGCVGEADAGEAINNARDAKTGLPILSLYGKTKRPTREQLEDIDGVIFDIQDVGARFYTYVSTLQYTMEACAENDKVVIVLDRPNPNGEYVDGPVLEPEFRSFVGLNPIPIAHGMTVGELALMINGERWLKGGEACRLKVIKMLNYTHATPYVLPIAPSPNLPTQNAIKWYPSICLFEGTAISPGRGTYSPFEVVGHPDLSAHFSFRFTPKSIDKMATEPRYKNVTCYGIDLQSSKPEAKIMLEHLIQMFRVYPRKEEFFNPFFNKLAGNSKLQEQIKKGMSEQEIRASWKEDLDKFKEIRARYLIYPE